MATKCRDRLHELVKEELQIEESSSTEWKSAMEQSFRRMDKEVIGWNDGVSGAKCKCELQSPECDAVGSTAVVAILTPEKIVVANCGDSRAVLCRNGKPVPLSSDHKVSFRSASSNYHNNRQLATTVLLLKDLRLLVKWNWNCMVSVR